MIANGNLSRSRTKVSDTRVTGVILANRKKPV